MSALLIESNAAWRVRWMPRRPLLPGRIEAAKDQNIEKPEAEKLGQINALVIEAAEGKVHAVMGFGRLGARDTYFSVPWSV